jgi:Fe2+ or Zn2+ uptake regulation protein
LDKYVDILRQHHLKVTHQRLSILKYLDKNRNHPTADGIYTALKQKTPSLSKTTVYNALETLNEHGLIHTLTICGSELRFDIQGDNHHHFLCKKCGKIYDIGIKCPNVGKVEEYGHKVEEIHGYFKGICKTCLRKKGEHTHGS